MQRICTRICALELSYVQDGICKMVGRMEDWCSRNVRPTEALMLGGRPLSVLVLKGGLVGTPMLVDLMKVRDHSKSLEEGLKTASPMDEILVGSWELQVALHHLADRLRG